MNNYFIKDFYTVNLTDAGSVVQKYTQVPADTDYQVSVYEYAAKQVRRLAISSVLELGCGSGYKLVKYIFPHCKDITGVDQSHAVEFLKKSHKVGTWLVDNFDNSSLENPRKYDLILAVDVIEHLVYPEKLLDKIKLHSHQGTHIIISTPERDKVRGKDSFGPPENKKHVREWNTDEFKRFIEHAGFKILKHSCVEAKSKSTWQALKDFLKGRDTRTCQFVHVQVA